ncbi:MAG: fructosamine kinase family protein [Anaerolineales bacterium]|nr:fructosamine kinase family protein [Anaerolineales bacterium]
MLPEPVRAYLIEQGWGAAARSVPVAGGCINAGCVLHLTDGPPLFLKQNEHAPADMFAREAAGLAALAQPDGPRLPRPLLVGEQFLLLEYLAPAPAGPRAWEVLGRQLAALHAPAAPAFGFPHANYLGRTPQPNPPTADGWVFFGEHRLMFQARLAWEGGRLPAEGLRQAERIAARLRELVPAQPASLIHGDLWGGNVIPGPEGELCLIDPAAHFGWAEAELAMTALFGGFPERFYAAYAGAAQERGRPLAPGWRERFPLYNLYHLLNHLNLFGRSYLDEVLAGLRRYGR